MSLLTDKEAQQKCCPMTMAFKGRSPGSVDSAMAASGNPKCIGTHCMAWRWSGYWRPETEEDLGYCSALGPMPEPPAAWIEPAVPQSDASDAPLAEAAAVAESIVIGTTISVDELFPDSK